jgi:hypothetical protein
MPSHPYSLQILRLSRPDLAIVKQADKDHASTNVPQRRRREPVKIGASGNGSERHSGEEFATACNAVIETAYTD